MDVPLDLLESVGGGVTGSGDVALGGTGVGRSLSVTGSLLSLVGASREQAAVGPLMVSLMLPSRHSTSPQALDSLADGVDGVSGEVAGLADELSEGVGAFGAVRGTSVIARLCARVLAESDDALGVVEGVRGELGGLVDERLVTDGAVGGVADLVGEGFVGGHGDCEQLTGVRGMALFSL